MVLVQFEVVLNFFDWFGLVLRNFLYKGNDEVSKELLSKKFQNPNCIFCYKLSYNRPN